MCNLIVSRKWTIKGWHWQEEREEFSGGNKHPWKSSSWIRETKADRASEGHTVKKEVTNLVDLTDIFEKEAIENKIELEKVKADESHFQEDSEEVGEENRRP